MRELLSNNSLFGGQLLRRSNHVLELIYFLNIMREVLYAFLVTVEAAPHECAII